MEFFGVEALISQYSSGVNPYSSGVSPQPGGGGLPILNAIAHLVMIQISVCIINPVVIEFQM